MLNRRQLLERSLLLSLAPLVPSFLTRTARAAGADKDQRVLVVIQLDGGNDGLNTVVPYRDDNYFKLRPKLKLDPNKLIKLNDEIGLHEAMKGAGKLFESGRLAIVQGVGYPNPDRSHFKSMSIWHSARLDETEHGHLGWLGRALDPVATTDNAPQAVFASSGTIAGALWGRHPTSLAIKSPAELRLDTPLDVLTAAGADADFTGRSGEASDLARFVAGASRDAFATSERLSSLLPTEQPSSDEQESRLSTQLNTIGSLIKAGCGARVFYTVQSGYDTHAAQQYDHYRLLRSFSSALEKFLDDLAAAGLSDRVLVLAFSEFGRRAAENASEGTDHGAAAPIFLAGPKLAAGSHGPTPNLAELVDGDVKMAIDFRQVYATVLESWLQLPQSSVLAERFEPLPLLTT